MGEWPTRPGLNMEPGELRWIHHGFILCGGAVGAVVGASIGMVGGLMIDASQPWALAGVALGAVAGFGYFGIWFGIPKPSSPLVRTRYALLAAIVGAVAASHSNTDVVSPRGVGVAFGLLGFALGWDLDRRRRLARADEGAPEYVRSKSQLMQKGERNGWVMIAFSFVLLAAGVSLIGETLLFVCFARAAMGTVVDHRVANKRAQADTDYYHAVVEFADGQGRVYRIETVSAPTDPLALGTNLPVFYPSGNPVGGRVGGNYLWDMPLVFLGGGLLFLCFGCVLVAGGRGLAASRLSPRTREPWPDPRPAVSEEDTSAIAL